MVLSARRARPVCRSAYDPYRIRKVLKRAGKRGENRWITIPFDQAVKEICEGGKLFSTVPGEESREVEGLRAIRAWTDARAIKEMGNDIKAAWDEKDAAKKQAMFDAFRAKHAAHLDKLIDPPTRILARRTTSSS
jgi:tetrathionate reductase subunit A